MKAIAYIKKNWKSTLFVLVIAGLILFNVKQYQQASRIVRENQEINLKYQALAEREIIYNQQIAEFKNQIAKKDSAIEIGKDKIEQTEAELSLSQGDVRRLSKKILNQKTDDPVAVQEYVNTCDSLAVVAPILADQVDTLKKENKALVKTMDEKSVLQDSIIKKKDVIITENKTLLASSIDKYNKATDQLVKTEDKYNKEKKRKNFWKKATVVLAAIVTGVIATK